MTPLEIGLVIGLLIAIAFLVMVCVHVDAVHGRLSEAWGQCDKLTAEKIAAETSGDAHLENYLTVVEALTEARAMLATADRVKGVYANDLVVIRDKIRDTRDVICALPRFGGSTRKAVEAVSALCEAAGVSAAPTKPEPEQDNAA